MQLTIGTALYKAVNFVGTTIQQVTSITKPQQKFFIWLLERWLMLPLRYNFLTLARYGGYCEKAIRDQFSKKLPFEKLYDGLYQGLRKKECVLAIDPTFISKAGKKTPDLGWFWNGTHQRAEKGLEATVLAMIDVEDRTAYHLEAVQTKVLAKEDKAAATDNRVVQYSAMVTERKETIQLYTKVIVADGFFMKKSFIDVLTKEGFVVVTKGRRDANLKYLYNGKQKGGKGRPKQFSGKVDLQSIDRRVWKVSYEEEEMVAYEAVVYSVLLKRKVKAVYVERKDRKGYEVLISTDVEMEGEKVLTYYRLRFQIEFLIRDAKTYTGLEHCQARSEEKLYNHWNMSLFSVSIVKWQWWAKLSKEKKETPFSMRSAKTYCLNKYMTQTIFANLELDMTSNKIKRLFNKCLNIGNMAT
jgi:hypothetical protein